MFRYLISFALLICLTSTAALAQPQEGVHGSIWRRALAQEPELQEAVERLRSDLEKGDAVAVSAQFRPGKVELSCRSTGLAAALFEHAQARSLLDGYFRGRGPLNLRISLARLQTDRAWIAFDLMSGQSSGIRPIRRRIVAGYELKPVSEAGKSAEAAPPVWQLMELGCP